MSDEEKLTQVEFHRKTAAKTNGGVWAVLDNDSPSEQELESALELAYTSRYHWRIAGTLTNDVRAVYMISRVFAHWNRGDLAVQYGNEMLELARKAEREDKKNWKDFDMPFVYEALAKAHAAAGNKEECARYVKLSQDFVNEVTNENDKKICQSELDKAKCN
ncbi:MAG: hypothetical protein EAX95_14540 [Candidatus Thorarchaeota archaeon]|nr:hypothetical protein [Candidatus Thorarchaeota archaeon]